VPAVTPRRLLPLLAAAALLAARAAGAGEVRHADDFSGDLRQWAVEQQPGGTVAVEGGRLVIEDRGGATVWFRVPLRAPAVIRYRATVTGRSRVSDLNCFWMADDPAQPGRLLEGGGARAGKFEAYDRLRLYYVGYGGNANSTTRFRRYDGTGAKPLLPEHDRRTPEFLLRADHTYAIEIRVAPEGWTEFVRDGEVVFRFEDSAPLREGWFGFRTVHSRIEIDDFEVRAWPVPSGAAPR
jgi:hypothetical protein